MWPVRRGGRAYREHFERSPVPQARCDSRARLVEVNAAFERLVDRPAERLTGRPISELSHRTDPGDADAALARLLAGQATATQAERILAGPGGRPVPALASATALDDGVVVVYQDLSPLHESERRYRAIADHADEGLWVTGPDGRTAYVNRRLEEILGLEAEELRDRTAGDLLGVDGGECSYHHPDGSDRILRVSCTPLDAANGATDGTLSMVTDVTEPRRLEHELREAALHDALTGLANRALLLDRLEHALARETTSTAVLFLDLDHFRVVNDDHGHAIGDEVLVAVTNRLLAGVRPSDTVGRLGGDQFVVICEDADQAAGLEIAHRLLEALRPAMPTTAGSLRIAASIGVAVTPTALDGSVLRHAETATYAAKAAGRGRVQLFDAAVAELARQRFELGVELARAIAAEELHLHYQPVVDLETGHVVGAEALARWDHPRLGPVPPDRFVAVAEAEGLTAELDGWAVRRALTEAARLVPATAYVAVNLSARTLGDPGLEGWVGAAAEDAGIAPEQVVLEVTESATMADPPTAARVLEDLRSRGFRIAVDDFGTGHSSLAYLRRLPVAMLKVDRSFVAELATDTGARAITASVVDLARTIGLTVVAEGVETAEQVAVLRRLGASSGQGWLWSRAVGPVEAVEALRRRYDVGRQGSVKTYD